MRGRPVRAGPVAMVVMVLVVPVVVMSRMGQRWCARRRWAGVRDGASRAGGIRGAPGKVGRTARLYP
ncbi:hypothetical protein SFR_4965 [Streptomyces sp. FR-008]|nr:hypothetical protein SFR_4965 [Streptomyces sp. FR-008]